MWTKREIVEFKDAIRKEGGDAIIKVFDPAQILSPFLLLHLLGRLMAQLLFYMD